MNNTAEIDIQEERKQLEDEIRGIVSTARDDKIYSRQDEIIWTQALADTRDEQLRQLAEVFAPQAINRAQESNQEFYALLEDAEHQGLMSKEDCQKELDTFRSPYFSQAERDKQKEQLETKLETARTQIEEYKKLLNHELIENQDKRLERFKKLPFKDREAAIETMKEKRKSREHMQALVREQTEESKKLCEKEEWGKALTHCLNAIGIIKNLKYGKYVEWFSHRTNVIESIVKQLESKIQETSDTRTNNKGIQEQNDTTIKMQEEKGNETSDQVFDDTQLSNIQHQLANQFIKSKTGIATTVAALTHAASGIQAEEKTEDLQTIVDAKETQTTNDYDEDNSFQRVEADSRRLGENNAKQVAFRKKQNNERILVDSNDRVMGLKERGQVVTSNLAREFREGANMLHGLTEEQEAEIEKGIETFENSNFGDSILVSTHGGLTEHQTTLGEHFLSNQENLAAKTASHIAQEIKVGQAA